jgi:hypothetical protein
MSIEEARQLVAVPETVDTVLIKNTDIDVEGELEIVKPLSATLSKRAQRSLCQLIDVPASFYHKSRKEVKAAILKQALEVPSKFKFILQDKTISNVVSSNAVYHPPKLVVDTMIETLMDHGYPLKGAMDVYPSERGFRIAFITEKNESVDTPVHVGDVTHAGVALTWEEDTAPGRGMNLDVEAYLYTLKCTNGMISPEVFSFNVANTNGDFKTLLADTTLKAAGYSSSTFLAQLSHLAKKRAENTAQLLARISEENRLGKSQLKRERQNMYALHQYDTRPIPPPGLGFGRFVDIDAKVADNLLLLTGSSWAVVIGLVLFWGSLYILRYHLG